MEMADRVDERRKERDGMTGVSKHGFDRHEHATTELGGDGSGEEKGKVERREKRERENGRKKNRRTSHVDCLFQQAIKGGC